MAGDSRSGITSSYSSSSSSTEQHLRKRKRHHQFLYTKYKSYEVSSQTRKKYEKIQNDQYNCQRQTKKDSSFFSNIDDEVITEMESEDTICKGNTINPNDSSDAVNNLDLEFCIYSEAKSDKIDNINEQVPNINIDENDICNSDSEVDIIYSNDSDDTINNKDSDNKSHNSDSIYSENEEFHSRFDQIMFDVSKLTLRDVILIVNAFSLRFHLSDEAQSVMMDIMKVCAGPKFEQFNISKYMMSKCFSKQDEKVCYHYYCTQCTEVIIYSVNAKKKLKNYFAMCEKCQERRISVTSASENYFISIDLKYQLRSLLSNDNIFNNILKNIDQLKNSHGTISAKIMNSQILKKNEYILILNCNTDGAPITKNGKKGFFPLQVVLNCLSPKLKSKYVLLAGILMAKNEPKSSLMNLYLLTFVEQLKYLYDEGIEIQNDGIKYLFKFCIVSITVDSVCRPVLQNRIQFNGYYGCTWCYQYGLYIQSIRGIRYVAEQESIHRTHDSHLKDVKRVLESGMSIQGVRGYSVLQDLPHIDMIWSFAYDQYMHSNLLGVTLQLLNLWKKSNCRFQISKTNLDIIEKRYLNIKPTHDIHRLPRSGIIKGKSSAQGIKPKASEMKSWLLYFSLPCLEGILDDEALGHYALLVKNTYILLKNENLPESELDKCENDIIDFVLHFQTLYGEEQMLFNVHALLHCVESVRKTGPLCLNSAFPFESFIYICKQYVNGPKGMDRQMARKHLQSQIYKVGGKDIEFTTDKVKTFCTNLFTRRRLQWFYEDSDDNVTFCGKGIIKYDDLIGNVCKSFKKCICKGNMYHSIKYDCAKRTDNSVVQLITRQFYRIKDIFKYNNMCYLRLSMISTHSDDPFPGVSHIKKVKTDEGAENEILTSIHDVKQKVIYINTGHA